MNSILGTIIVEEKKISWDDSIEKVLGKSFSDIHADYRNVTLRQLCERRGGTPSGTIYQRNKKVSPEKNRAWFIGELLKLSAASFDFVSRQNISVYSGITALDHCRTTGFGVKFTWPHATDHRVGIAHFAHRFETFEKQGLAQAHPAS